MIRFGLLATFLFVIPPVGSAEDNTPAASSEPKDLPIELKIVGASTAWELDTRGDPPFKFQEHIRNGEKRGELISATRVEFTLEIKNNDKASLRIWVSGDDTLLTFDLKGTGPMTAAAKPTGRPIATRALTIPGGKSHKIPITNLVDGFRMSSRHLYITEIGDYQLTATLKTAVSPAPNGSQALSGGFGEVILKSAPIKFHVRRPS